MSQVEAVRSACGESCDPPRHVAIIMDGNGRWAAQRGLPRAEGHRRGVEALRRTVRAAGDLGIDYLQVIVRLARDLRYISIGQYEGLAGKIVEIGRMNNGWMKAKRA